MGLNKT